jgi:hypothetical protein
MRLKNAFVRSLKATAKWEEKWLCCSMCVLHALIALWIKT